MTANGCIRRLLTSATALFVLFAFWSACDAADTQKVLRIASSDVTSLDPQQGTDLASTRVTGAIFEGLYQFDYFAEPATVIPNTAAGMPEFADGGRTWTIRLQRGILFASDPAFGGKPRELVAEDYVYSIKRSLDPTLRNGGDSMLADLIVGARAVVDAASVPGARFNYEAPIAGLRALDSHTLRITLTALDYTLLDRLASPPAFAVAREAVESAGVDVIRRPVGTGPYRLRDWQRGSRIVLEANPQYRHVTFPDSTDTRHRAVIEAMKNKTLPRIGRIEINVVQDSQAALRAFDRQGLDYVALAADDTARVLAEDKLKSAYTRRGIVHLRFGVPTLTFTYFNMRDPTVGGYTREQIALRQAIAMGFDTSELIRVQYGGNALQATQLLPPGVTGHDPALAAKSLYDPAGARALLDRNGFKDRDGDGYRETPDGKQLTLLRGSLPEAWHRAVDALWSRNMQAIGIRMNVKQEPFADMMMMSLNSKLPMFNLGVRSLEPSGFQVLQTLWGQSPTEVNPSRFSQEEYDRAYAQFLRTPAGPQRTQLARRMSEIAQAYMPLLLQTFGVGNVLLQPWVQGYWPSQFGFAWKYLDIDVARARRR